MEKSKNNQLDKNNIFVEELPLFFTYKIRKKIDNDFKFYSPEQEPSDSYVFICGKCNREFKEFFVLKRHVLEVEYNKKEKCNYCLGYFKRVIEHYPHCNSFLKFQFNSQVNKFCSKRTTKKNIRINNNFDIQSITQKVYEELISTEKYHIIDNSFVYFPEFFIGEGCYGAVVFGIKLNDFFPLAIKVQKHNNGKDYLNIENEILSQIPNDLAFPKVYYHEANSEGNILIESLLGPTLKKLFKFSSFNLDIKTIYNIGLDILECFELLHSIGYVHLDLKLDNVAIQFKNKNNNKSNLKCVLLDFGKAINFLNLNKKKEKLKNRKFGGNKNYSSVNILKGGIPSPKDDLISLVYLLSFLYKGYLPWSFLEENDKNRYFNNLIKEKEKFSPISFCGNDFSDLNIIFNDLNKISSNDKPNYFMYKKIFSKFAQNNYNSETNEFRFKWEEKFMTVMREFNYNNNYSLLTSTINELFDGIPHQLAYSFLTQFSLKI